MMAVETLNPGMPLSQLLAGWADVPINADVHIGGVALDSRRVQPGDVFIAVRGRQADGRAFIADALHHGAVAVVVEGEIPETLVRHHVAAVSVDDLAARAGLIAARFYGEPSRDLRMVGITGTNGKTSVASYCAQALSADAVSCGLIGTLGYGVYGRLETGPTTTPDPVSLQQLLARLRNDGVHHAVMEVSSHALEQGRINGTVFELAVFTNLSRDHLDYHADMEAYGSAKRRLFELECLRHGLVNIDDAFGREILATAKVPMLSYSLDSAAADLHARIVERARSHMKIEMHTPWGNGEVTAGLSGAFNAANLLATLGVLCLLDIPFENALTRLSGIRPAPGRMQLFGGDHQPLVVVDYAHTPDALTQALQTLRADCRGRLWCVFGCGGERDTGKRPLMGAAAEQHADYVVITSDNPRAEEPQQIIAGILAGVSNPEAVLVEPDRRGAIAMALEKARTEDTVLIAGKGHETWQEIAGVRHPFSDQQVVQACLQGRQ